MATMMVTAIVSTQVQAPRLALLPVATPPGGGLLLSALIHAAAVISVLTWLPSLFPARALVAHTPKEIIWEPDRQALMLPVLPRMKHAGSRARLKSSLGKTARSITKAVPGDGEQTDIRPKFDFAGPQEIVSDLPDSTNSVQTIRRPDLVAPPKLANPIRLPSMVMLPALAAPKLVAPQLAQPELPSPLELPTFKASEPRVQVPALPIGTPKLPSRVPVEAMAPKITGTFDHSSPAFAATTNPEVPAPKAVVVINAVSISSESAPAIPDAELSGNFAVGPSRDENAGKSKPAAADRNTAGTGASSAEGKSLNSTGGSGSGIGANASGLNVGGRNAGGANAGAGDSGGGNAGAAQGGSLSGMGTRLESGAAGAAAGNAGLPGISISGGIPGRSGRAVAINPAPHGSYSLTIISGGSSGGASRDLGVFSRSDTVYTVYISMADAGGGPDWPMEYTLMSSAPAGNGLLAPPIVLKKIRATGPKTGLTANSGPVFVTAIIDEKGALKGVRAIRALDARAKSAVNALAQWEFLPAQLEGKPVASKILIGVSIIPSEEVRKQD